MLRIGLTGGIGAGKSTVSATFSRHGGVIVDGDVIAREVVEPGTEGLAKLVEAFGPGILLSDGALDRPALAAIAFSDDDKRAILNGIVHPLVAHRRSELIAEAGDEAVIVEDIPLLVESQMAPLFPLVVVVHADIETRVTRLTHYRGMSEEDARARIAAQATEPQRRDVADVWLDNSGDPDQLAEQALELWHQRIKPFAHNLITRQTVPSPTQLMKADPTWPDQAQRILARLRTACGHRAVRVDHIGSTAVRWPEAFEARDVIDVQVTVASLAVADELTESLLRAGYPAVETITADNGKPDARSTVAEFDHAADPALWRKRIHASADPGRATNVHIRVQGWPNQQFALLFPAWLSADAAAQAEYLAIKRDAERAGIDGGIEAYASVKEPWFDTAYRQAWAWADATGWRP
ncbi:dephospho-CoA kinase [Mycolicibacter arupensis]|uniref:Dephospho-CoA kinase n=1 Tax=Mycolicibacter arupensis TaxID=342002 RepID=A0A0F5MYX4_9MYCO|nr:dephospho-CoA kinase [Mycolicibacter arupensis]KKB99906.1 dephospho-CoA kinase [Mycolicibacter arupensis]MCV7277613.1 dephospho-CoA kinase [Mycolicibacter arupensis]ORA00034.1 dephospho-CoA kinase [Mycolicibacter arupensis]